jgi:mono/diheme cytochrome c family protein
VCAVKRLKIVGWILVALFVLVLVAITATIGWRPFIGPNARALTDRTFASTPERVDRGRYLTENLLNCFACHSERDWAQQDVPIVKGMHGAGAPVFPLKDLPGDVHPPNITPDKETGAGNWTDDQLARAIREGIGNDGRALFPFMPYENFRYLSDEDLASVIVYLRSLAPVRRAVPKTELIFPVKYLIRSAPQPLDGEVPAPDMSTPVKRGDYLVTIGGCRDCHSPQHNGQRIEELDLAGGFFLRGPWGEVASANITQAPSGIPYYDERLFMDAMRTGWVKARQLKPIMPWWNYRGLTDDDLKSIFAYLRGVPQVAHRVDNSKPPTECRLCRFSHGAGDQN